eukprot:1137726-Pelagomonas_calceolata.AAC.7
MKPGAAAAGSALPGAQKSCTHPHKEACVRVTQTHTHTQAAKAISEDRGSGKFSFKCVREVGGGVARITGPKHTPTRGYKGKRPQSRLLTASLFIDAHEIMKEKRKYKAHTHCANGQGHAPTAHKGIKRFVNTPWKPKESSPSCQG